MKMFKYLLPLLLLSLTATDAFSLRSLFSSEETAEDEFADEEAVDEVEDEEEEDEEVDEEEEGNYIIIFNKFSFAKSHTQTFSVL